MNAQILVLNSGSSSLKFQLIEMPEEKVVCEGMAERIGAEAGRLKLQAGGKAHQEDLGQVTHKGALERIAELLRDPAVGGIRSGKDLAAVGHRVVHGGNRFSSTTQVDEAVKKQIRDLSRLAPLHNPPNLEGILLAETLFPGAIQVAVFDTAFHQTIPLKARKYAIPNALFRDHGVQVYGFHGTSHKYVYEQIAPRMGKDARIVSLHLGNGCSATAIRNGKSIDHSLGFTPSNGLIMGSRSGDIDHGIIFFLVESLGYSLAEVNELLTKESGLLGLTGYTDFRDIQQGAERGEENCVLAMEMAAYRIRKYIGAYAAAMNGLDGLIFTAGIGEHSSALRKAVCQEMEYFGIHLDADKNEHPGGGVQAVHASDSRVQIWVVPTDEELEIARQAYQVY
ncbi:MAG: acetate kinase, partial [Robiginitalea sp.]|nr:acetate kinase [Robiginitalea sp.]